MGTILEDVHEIARDMHEGGFLSDERMREYDFMCQPRRPRWRVRLGDTLDGWITRTRRFFFWDHLWQRRVECYLKGQLGKLWQGQPDSPETLGRE